MHLVRNDLVLPCPVTPDRRCGRVSQAPRGGGRPYRVRRAVRVPLRSWSLHATGVHDGLRRRGGPTSPEGPGRSFPPRVGEPGHLRPGLGHQPRVRVGFVPWSVGLGRGIPVHQRLVLGSGWIGVHGCALPPGRFPRMNAVRWLRVLLRFIPAFHLVAGIGLMFSIPFQHWAVSSYGARLSWDTRDIYFIRIIGSFAFVLGYLAAMAAKDPLKHR